MLVYDSGGGWNNTITSRAWALSPPGKVQYYDDISGYIGYETKRINVSPMALTKATITGHNGCPYEILLRTYNSLTLTLTLTLR